MRAETDTPRRPASRAARCRDIGAPQNATPPYTKKARHYGRTSLWAYCATADLTPRFSRVQSGA